MAFRKRTLALAISLTFEAATAAAAPLTADSDAALPEVKVTADKEAPATYNAPTATTATKIEAPLRDIPQTVNVVPKSLMRDQAMRSMQDALHWVPGVGLSTGDGQRDQVTIRGFSAIADQFVDGLRDDALYFRELSNVEQIEVLKGPASVLYGRGSSGGLINRVTKKPGVDRAEIDAQVGSWRQRRGEFDIGRGYRDGLIALRATGAIERAESYRDQQFLERDAFAPSIAWKPGAATELIVQAEHLSDRRVTDFGIPAYRGRPVDVAASTYYGAANARDADFTQTRVSAAGFTATHRLFESQQRAPPGGRLLQPDRASRRRHHSPARRTSCSTAWKWDGRKRTSSSSRRTTSPPWTSSTRCCR